MSTDTPTDTPSTNPVFHHTGGPMYDDGSHPEVEGWYFWTETWADYCGPYSNEEEANRKLKKYCRYILGDDSGNRVPA